MEMDRPFLCFDTKLTTLWIFLTMIMPPQEPLNQDYGLWCLELFHSMKEILNNDKFEHILTSLTIIRKKKGCQVPAIALHKCDNWKV